MPFGTMVVDGAHIYEPTAEARDANRQRAYRWLSVGATLGMKQIRIDAGGPEEMPDDVFQIIVEGYRDLIDRAGRNGIELLVENHWGPSIVPENIERLMDGNPRAWPAIGYKKLEAGRPRRRPPALRTIRQGHAHQDDQLGCRRQRAE